MTTPWPKVVGIGVALSVVLGVLVLAFAWPSVNSEPRDLPLAVAGPEAGVIQVEQQLDTAVPGAFEIVAQPDAEAARAAIADREVYGAIILDPQGPPQVLTASAASPVVAQLLEQVASRFAAEGTGAPAPAVEDVVPLPDDDPRGAGFASGALPMVIGGMAVGSVMSLVVTGVGRAAGGALLASAGGGLVVVAVQQFWIGALDGDYWSNAGVIGLTIAAISLTLVGLRSLLGNAGIALGAATMLLVGNPLSGLTSAPEMLPEGWSALGQALPPGAGGTLLRSTAFFDGAAAGGPLLVLLAWLAGGAALVALGAALGSRRSRSGTADSGADDVAEPHAVAR